MKQQVIECLDNKLLFLLNKRPLSHIQRKRNKDICDYLYMTIFSCVYELPSGSVVKNPPAKVETQVQSLGPEDPLEKEMATHSSILV